MKLLEEVGSGASATGSEIAVSLMHAPDKRRHDLKDEVFELIRVDGDECRHGTATLGHKLRSTRACHTVHHAARIAL